jgi:hypothetical protein
MVAINNANPVSGTQARASLSHLSQHRFKPSRAADDERPGKRWLCLVDLGAQLCRRCRLILARLRSGVHRRLKSHRHNRLEVHRGQKPQIARAAPLSMLFEKAIYPTGLKSRPISRSFPQC